MAYKSNHLTLHRFLVVGTLSLGLLYVPIAITMAEPSLSCACDDGNVSLSLVLTICFGFITLLTLSSDTDSIKNNERRRAAAKLEGNYGL